MRKKTETPQTLRGIRSQLRVAINSCRDGATAEIPVGLAYRLETALQQWEQEMADALEVSE